LYNADDIVISVVGVYPVAVQVTGMVRRPGTYIGYTSQRVSELIDSAGGILSTGSPRRVTISGGPTDVPADIPMAQATGDLSFDPCLYSGNRVFVPELRAPPVIVTGSVLHPGSFELLPGEGFEQLVGLAGGLKADARSSGVVVNGHERDLSQPDAIKPGDRVWVPSSIAPGDPSEVIVTGAAANTGRHVRLPADRSTLSDFLEHIGGLAPDANRNRVAVFRLARDPILEEPTSERYPVWVGSGNTEEIRLEQADSIHVPRLLTHVEVIGLVQRPGFYPYPGGRSVNDFVTMAGGLVVDKGEVLIEVFDRVTGLTRAVTLQTIVYDGDRIIVKQGELDR
jgi:protein involved in polysaccharide export with SLBB domain